MIAPVPLNATCGSCRWWFPDDSGSAVVGYCHQRPPVIEGWPQTHRDEDVCGGWESEYPDDANDVWWRVRRSA
jgi:hypothetical protein